MADSGIFFLDCTVTDPVFDKSVPALKTETSNFPIPSSTS